MPIDKRTISCDVVGCTIKLEETEYGLGFPGWGVLQGVELNGVPNPALCPTHLESVMEVVDNLRGE